MPTEQFLLACRNLSIGYGGRPLLPAFDMEIRPGELWAVLGRNGSGKSTWIRTLLGLIAPVSGSVVRSRPDLKLAYLPQRQAFDELYPVLVRDVVAMGAERGLAVFGLRRRDVADKVLRALSLVQASDLAPRPYRELSAGQKQRVLLARLAAGEPDLAVLDEPTSAMDVVAEREAYELLSRLQRERRVALVIVSHFLGLARRYADRALLLDRDTPGVVAGAAEEVLAHESFRKRYGDSLPPGP
jgi:zinc transport system ATP-binding protein